MTNTVRLPDDRAGAGGTVDSAPRTAAPAVRVFASCDPLPHGPLPDGPATGR